MPTTLCTAGALAAFAAAGCSVRRARVPLVPPVVRIVARDYAFDGPDSIDAGPTTIRVVSRGTKVHVTPVVRLPPNHSVAELLDSLERHAPKPWVVSLGDDVHDHRPHFLHGMMRQVAVH